MKNLQKGFIVPLLFVIVALLLIGGGTYVYTQQKQDSQPVAGNQTTQTAQTTSTELNKGKILPQEFSSEVTTTTLLEPFFGKPTPVDYPSVKYYDDKIVIVDVPSIRGCAVVWVYDRSTQTKIQNAFGDQDGCGLLFEDDNHLVVVSNSKVFVWKVGDAQPKVLVDSILSTGETYDSGVGMGSQVDATLNGSVLTLVVHNAQSFAKVRSRTFSLQ